MGILAIVLWSSTFAVARSLAEQLGTVTMGALVCLLGGSIGLACMIVLTDAPRKLRKLSLSRQTARGALLVAYKVCIFLAVGLAHDRQQVLEVSIINYLWPGLTLVFSIPILHHRAKWGLVPGMAIAIAGVVLAVTQNSEFSWGYLGKNLRLNSLPYLLALVAAVSWALYSNVSRRYSQSGDETAVPVFLIGAGVLLGAGSCMFPESTEWSMRGASELLYMAIFPVFLAYTFWSRAVRKGSVILLASLSHLTPLLAMIISCLYLRIAPGAGLWVACGLVIVGAAICKVSVISDEVDS
jgi:drug/metabolite transporter (DMT)-like permease